MIGCDDIGGGGIRLSISRPLREKDKIEVLIYAKDDPKPISALCRVIWCKRVEINKVKVGLEFIKIKDYLRFTEFLCEKMVDLSFKKIK